MKSLTITGCCASLILLAACSDTARKSSEKSAEKKPAEPVTGRYALYQMYPNARGWAADIQVLRLNSIHLPEVKAEPGKAAAWQVTFVSPGTSRARSYTYSVIEAQGNLYKGVFAGLEEGWSGPRGQLKPFLLAAVKKDSDEAYQTALKKGAAYDAKNPGKTISFLLELTSRFPDPAWRVIWGESAGTSNFSIFVDASTGEYLQTMR
jgi:hypothetical protein